MRYIVQRGNNFFGPFEEGELVQLVKDRALSEADRIAPEGTTYFIPLSEWKRYQTVLSSLQRSANPPATVNPLPAKSDRHNAAHTFTATAQTKAACRPSVPGNHYAQGLQILFRKFCSWFLIAIVPVVLNILFIGKVSSLMQQQSLSTTVPVYPGGLSVPGNRPLNLLSLSGAPVIPPDQIIKLIIVGFIVLYFSATALVMVIHGASASADGIDFRLSDLLTDVQKKIPKFLGVIFGLAITAGLLYLPLLILPKVMVTLGYYIISCFVMIIFYKFSLLPVISVLENCSLAGAVKQSLKLTRIYASRMITLWVIIIFINSFLGFLNSTFTAIPASPLIFGFLGLVFNLLALIWITLFYKEFAQKTPVTGLPSISSQLN